MGLTSPQNQFWYQFWYQKNANFLAFRKVLFNNFHIFDRELSRKTKLKNSIFAAVAQQDRAIAS